MLPVTLSFLKLLGDLHGNYHFSTFVSQTAPDTDSNKYSKRNIYDRTKWPSFTAHARITNNMIESNIDKEPDNI